MNVSGNEFLQVFRRRTLVAFVSQGHDIVINSLFHWQPMQFFQDGSNVFSLPSELSSALLSVHGRCLVTSFPTTVETLS